MHSDQKSDPKSSQDSGTSSGSGKGADFGAQRYGEVVTESVSKFGESLASQDKRERLLPKKVRNEEWKLVDWENSDDLPESGEFWEESHLEKPARKLGRNTWLDKVGFFETKSYIIIECSPLQSFI